MRILITNDDGIEAQGIRLLTEWAKRLGEVTVVAPKVEQSAKSHGIELIRPIEVKRSSLFDGITAYSVDSTPADCVRFGILGLGESYDLVLSGINKGANIGIDISYSGTVSAMLEADIHGHKSLAISTFPDTLEEAARHLDMMYAYISENRLLEKNSIYNVNIPAKVRGIQITRQGRSGYTDEFRLVGDDLYKQYGVFLPDSDKGNRELDDIALYNGYISITPMTNNKTNNEVFMLLNN